MSYEFHLFTRVAGEEPIETACSDWECQLQLTYETRARNARIADELCALDPTLERHEYEGGLQLVSPPHGSGVTVDLFAVEALVAVPFPGSPALAAPATATAREYLRIVQRRAGYFVYDPQLNRIVLDEHDVAIDDDFVVACGAPESHDERSAAS